MWQVYFSPCIPLSSATTKYYYYYYLQYKVNKNKTHSHIQETAGTGRFASETSSLRPDSGRRLEEELTCDHSVVYGHPIEVPQPQGGNRGSSSRKFTCIREVSGRAEKQGCPLTTFSGYVCSLQLAFSLQSCLKSVFPFGRCWVWLQCLGFSNCSVGSLVVVHRLSSCSVWTIPDQGLELRIYPLDHQGSPLDSVSI